MTQEDKQLLLRDLCARLPYGVKVQTEVHDTAILDPLYLDQHEILHPIAYLRPMSSMTEEERERVYLISQEGNIEYQYGVFYRCQDYLNSIHVDYRGLIEMGLALEAPEGMYK